MSSQFALSAEAADVIFAALKEKADQDHAQWAQYRGHFEKAKGWKIARVNRKIVSKMGVGFLPGDVILARVETIEDFAGDQSVIWGYSTRTRAVTAISRSDVITFAKVLK